MNEYIRRVLFVWHAVFIPTHLFLAETKYTFLDFIESSPNYIFGMCVPEKKTFKVQERKYIYNFLL